VSCLMNKYKADLHLHTVLSPCGDLDMSPTKLVIQAKRMGLKIIGISDHNSTKHAELISRLAKKEGIFVLCGAEITSKEEIHLLCFMPHPKSLKMLQRYIDKYLIKTAHSPKNFGEQLLVNEHEEVVAEEEFLLINAIDRSINEISDFVIDNGGIFIPAHINRAAYSLLSQLGVVPPDLVFHALEIYKYSPLNLVNEADYLKNITFIQSSDAHYIPDIGKATTDFYMNKLCFSEVKMALAKEQGRYCEIQNQTKEI